jgi:hypothetical protein
MKERYDIRRHESTQHAARDTDSDGRILSCIILYGKWEAVQDCSVELTYKLWKEVGIL